MMRSLLSITRDPLWTAWDANTRVYRQPPKVRKLLRRYAKRRQNQLIAKEVSSWIIDIMQV